MIPAFSLAAAVLVSVPASQAGGVAHPPGRSAAADTAGPVYSGRQGELDVSPPRFESVEISIDARLDEPPWSEAAVLTGFTQYEPNEAIPASQETEILVFYTSDAIYFGIRALDSNPEGIQVTRTERDRSVIANDWVRLMLDTFHDQRRAYTFFVNPLGIQTDAIWLEELEPLGGPTGPKIDFNPDYVWDSEGRVTDEGWVAEIRIPYVSLRFREQEVQSWGLQVARGVTRTGFKSSWAPLTLNISNVLAQSGTLSGLRGLEPQRLVEFTPVVTAQRTGEVVNGDFTRGGTDPELGVDASIGLTQNLVLDGTVNPDFSQVEADVDQIEVNERFALFFPEKRPFFLDGTEVFQTFQRLVHTRRIVDPLAGAKITGKVGDFSLGYLGSVDQSPSTFGDFDHDAIFNLVRARKDLGEGGSTLGLLYTDRTTSDGEAYNRVASTDLRLLLGERYAWETQLTGSWTRPRGGGGDTSLKPFVTTSFRRNGQKLNFSVRMEDIHPDFRTRSGFIPRLGDTEVEARVQGTRFGAPGALVERYGLELRSSNFFRHDDFWDGRGPFEYEVELWPRIDLRNDRSFTFVFRNGWFSFQDQDYAAYATRGPGGGSLPFATPAKLENLKGAGVLPNVRINDELRIEGRAFFREVPIFVEGSRGFEIQVAPEFRVRPTSSLDLELSHTFSRIWRTEDDTRFSTVNISRVRAQYHFTEAVRARVIGQWDLEKRSALRDPTTGRPVLVNGELADASELGGFLTQLLLAYEPSPGRVFFVGFSRAIRGDYGYGLADKDPVSEGLFAKVSYLFRL